MKFKFFHQIFSCPRFRDVRAMRSLRFLLLYFFFKKRFYLFIVRERRRERGRDGEKHQCAVASCTPPTGDLACNPGMCPDWELNRQPLGSQASAQSTEPHQPGLLYFLSAYDMKYNRLCVKIILSRLFYFNTYIYWVYIDTWCGNDKDYLKFIRRRSLSMSPFRAAARICAGRCLHFSALWWNYLSYRKLIHPRSYSLPTAAV